MLESNKSILIYSFEEEEIIKINSIFKSLSLPEAIVVEKSMTEMLVSDLVRGIKLDKFNVEVPVVKLVLFNNLTEEELNNAVVDIRKKFTEKPIMAVVTPTSEKWTFKFLIGHLIEENKWAKKR